MTFGSVRAAFGFLTRIPVGAGSFSKEDLRWAPAHFPLVGAVIGSILAAVYAACAGWGPLVAATLTVGVSLVLTGAFHEDGLADSADGLGGGYTPERVLDILKDSRLGTFGTVALVVSILLRVLLIAQRGSWGAFVLIEALSRTPPVVVLALIPYASRPDAAKSKDLTASGLGVAVLACGWATLILTAGVTFGVVSLAGCTALLVLSAGVAFFFVRYVLGRVGGITGDFLGALQQLTALSLWLAW